MLSSYESSLREATPAKKVIYFWAKNQFELSWDFDNAPLAYLPVYAFSYYNIDTKQIICDVYSSRYGFDWYKINSNGLSEYYTRSHTSEFTFTAYNLDTMTPIEYYKLVDTSTEHKYDVDMNLLQVNYSTENDLPPDWVSAISDFKYKNSIICWEEKPYGRIVEFCGEPTF
jgi:hypothetical protein